MITQTEQIVEEYIFMPDNSEFTIKGRVCKIVFPEDRSHYTWAISHFYRPSEDAISYSPSIVTAESAEEAKQHLFAYALGYSGIDPNPNPYY